MLVTGFPPRERARLAPQLEAVRALLGEAEDIRRTGSAALDLAWVAAGRADGYFEAGVKAWDIAAGILLVREAGGRVCDFRGRGEKLLDAAIVAVKPESRATPCRNPSSSPATPTPFN